MRVLSFNSWSKKVVKCDGWNHITYDKKEEVYRWPCNCGLPVVVVHNQNIGAECHSTEGD